MNIVAIDPSLISTALVVTSGDTFKMFNYCRESSAFGKTGIKKWFKLAEQYVTYKFIEYREFEDYSEGELTKLKDYDKITDDIIKDILDNINPTKPTKVGIEGYSFSSTAGDIIDLVTFSTLLRKKLFDKISEDITVLSPSTLKLESCKLTYPPIIKEIGGKKPRQEFIWRNTMGISGGKFQKTEMFKAITDNDDLNDNFMPANLRLGVGFDFIFDEYNKISVIGETTKLLVPTPPKVGDEDNSGAIDNTDYTIANNEYRKIGWVSGIFQSFGDAPDGLSEEFKEFTYALGAEYWYQDSFALRTGYFHESEVKGARKFFTLGAGFKYNIVKIDVSYLFSASKVRNPLENTLRFSLTFNFGDKYDEL